MPEVTYIRPDGSRGRHEVPTGISVMQAALAHGEDGIVAECGGSLMCATCHVYVEDRFAGLLPAPGAEEEELLTCTAAVRRPTSRLSCQLVVTPEMTGLVVELPAEQV